MPIISLSEAETLLRAFWPDKVLRHVETLDHVRSLMVFLGNPQDQVRVVHIAGTSGKTSTAYYTAALLTAAGHKVGLTISPHVDQLNERVQINMKPLSEARFCAALEEFLELVKRSGERLNHHEMLYAFGYWYFAREHVDYAVIEVGMGGLLDATNVVHREDKVCIITDIGFDHTRLLGSSIRDIAGQKAGIILLHNTVFCHRQDPVVMEVIEAAARKHQADLHVLSPKVRPVPLPALPLFQQRNMTLAVQAVEYILRRNHQQSLTRLMLERAARTYIPARMEVFEQVGKTIIIDAAHNAQKFEALAQSIRHRYGSASVALLVSLTAGREYRITEAARELAALAEHIIVTSFGPLANGRMHSMSPEMLEQACRREGAESVEVIPEVTAAFSALLARPEPILVVSGSFFLLNHIRPLVRRTAT